MAGLFLFDRASTNGGLGLEQLAALSLDAQIRDVSLLDDTVGKSTSLIVKPDSLANTVTDAVTDVDISLEAPLLESDETALDMFSPPARDVPIPSAAAGHTPTRSSSRVATATATAAATVAAAGSSSEQQRAAALAEKNVSILNSASSIPADSSAATATTTATTLTAKQPGKSLPKVRYTIPYASSLCAACAICFIMQA